MKGMSVLAVDDIKSLKPGIGFLGILPKILGLMVEEYLLTLSY